MGLSQGFLCGKFLNESVCVSQAFSTMGANEYFQATAQQASIGLAGHNNHAPVFPLSQKPVNDNRRKILCIAGQQYPSLLRRKCQHAFVVSPFGQEILDQYNVRAQALANPDQPTLDMFVEQKTRNAHAACPVMAANCTGDRPSRNWAYTASAALSASSASISSR